MRSISFLVGGVLLALSAVASASVVGDFEGSVDGFTNVGSATLSSDSSAASLNASSLLVTDSGTGWSQSVKKDISSIWAEVAPGGALSLDIKAAGGAPNIPAWWLQLIPVINSENGGWNQGSFGNFSLDNNWHTVSWTFPAMSATPGGWGEVFLISNSSDVRSYNIDNVRISAVPEPGSATVLLALGAISRRRRA